MRSKIYTEFFLVILVLRNRKIVKFSKHMTEVTEICCLNLWMSENEMRQMLCEFTNTSNDITNTHETLMSKYVTLLSINTTASLFTMVHLLYIGKNWQWRSLKIIQMCQSTSYGTIMGSYDEKQISRDIIRLDETKNDAH